jgi:tetratricopeptide (TPR) repeat protein
MTENGTAGPGDPAAPSGPPTNTAEDLYRQAAESGHPDPLAYAHFALGELLESRGEADAAAQLYRKAAESGNAEMSAEARLALGELLKSRGDVAGARSAWQAVIDSRSTAWWAESAFISLVNLLFEQNETDGLRAAYRDGVAKGNPEALYALDKLGQQLLQDGDVENAHAAWQQAIDAGYEHADYLRDRISPPPKPGEDYPASLPPQFNPNNMIRTGLDVLEHGLPALPETLTYEMAIPMAYWKADQCAVVLVLLYFRHGRAKPEPSALKLIYSRAEHGWKAPTGASGGGFAYDPVAGPGNLRDLGGRLMVRGGTSEAAEVTPGRPAFTAAGRAAPEVRSLVLIQDGREDRRLLESHFGAWVICTDRPPPLDLAGIDRNGNVVARLSFGPPRRRPSGRTAAGDNSKWD